MAPARRNSVTEKPPRTLLDPASDDEKDADQVDAQLAADFAVLAALPAGGSTAPSLTETLQADVDKMKEGTNGGTQDSDLVRGTASVEVRPPLPLFLRACQEDFLHLQFSRDTHFLAGEAKLSDMSKVVAPPSPTRAGRKLREMERSFASPAARQIFQIPADAFHLKNAQNPFVPC